MSPQIGEPVELQTSYRSPLVQQALEELASQLMKPGTKLNGNDGSVKDFLRLKLSGQQREVFAVVFLSCSTTVIAYEELFYGSIDHTDVSIREVVKRALHYNAASMLVVHNHPSGNSNPSRGDVQFTRALKNVMEALDIKIYDHYIVGGNSEMKITSLAKLGLL